MSLQLIAHSQDLQRLLNEGYDIEIRSGYLFVKDVPYVKSDRTIGLGTLISALRTSGDTTMQPDNHVALWIGEFPCDGSGRLMDEMGSRNQDTKIDNEVTAKHIFSRKPVSGTYSDYYHKMTTYIAFLEGQAQKIDANITARTFAPYMAREGESAFNYVDTASSRSGITSITHKLEGKRIGIVGLGGTGSYILDLVAKTPVKEIHLYDDDLYLTHNAFRSPGAPSVEDLRKRVKKVNWLAEIYSKIHRGIIPHDIHIDSSCFEQLKGLDFVFLCLSNDPNKRSIIDHLVGNSIPFIDGGMGLFLADESLGGIVRVTLCTSEKKDHINRRIIFGDNTNDDYRQNIQIADLNALNAVLAVIRWKKESGFYINMEKEFSTAYTISRNVIDNDEQYVKEMQDQA